MNKQVKIIVALLALFAALIGFLLFLNRDAAEAGRIAQEQKTITVTCQGETLSVMDEDTIKALPSETFEATIRSHGMKPEYVEYRGVEIHTFLQAAGITPQGKDRLHFIGADTYLAAVNAEEMQDHGCIYIVYEKNGEEMTPRAEGGEGPFQIILLGDAFSQRWCKFLSEIEWEKAE